MIFYNYRGTDIVQMTLLYFVVLLASSHGKVIPTFAGPFILAVDRIRECDVPNNPLKMNVSVSHYLPARPLALQTVTGVAVYNLTVTDDWWVDMRLDVRSNNQWKQNAFVFRFPKNACTVAKEFAPQSLQKYIFTLKGKCVINPERVELHAEPLPWDFRRVPVMPYGIYRCTMSWGNQDNSSRACGEGFVNVLPRPR